MCNFTTETFNLTKFHNNYKYLQSHNKSNVMIKCCLQIRAESNVLVIDFVKFKRANLTAIILNFAFNQYKEFLKTRKIA